MDSKPFFSVLIPTRNRHDLIRCAIDSVLKQNFNDFELVVLDNSTDEKTRINITDYIEKEKRIRYIKTGNLNMPENWEAAYKNALGENLIILTDRMFFSRDSVLNELFEIHKKYPNNIITYDWVIEGKKKVYPNGVNYIELQTEKILKNFFNGGSERHIFNLESPKGLNTSLPRKIYQIIIDKYQRMCFPLSPDFGMSFVLLHEGFPVIHVNDGLIISGGMDVSNGNQNKRNKEGIINFLTEYNYSEEVLYRSTPVPVAGLFNSMYNDFFELSNKFNWGYSWSQINMVEYFVLLRDEIVNNEYEADKSSDLKKWEKALELQPQSVILEVERRVKVSVVEPVKPLSLFNKLKSRIKKKFN